MKNALSAEDLAAALQRSIAPPTPAIPGAGAVLEPIVVRLKSATKELAPRYLERCRADVARMKDDLDRGNFDALRGTGHMLKGTGGSYGFEEMTRIATGIESAAEASDRDRLRQLVAQLESYLERVKPEYE
jgi:HPt (histidine-containing phosphotransfer) domain-containing protein